jgi:16S rRNA (cytosine967-C5)-methyltransferase
MNVLACVLSSLTEHGELSKYSNLALSSHKLDGFTDEERRLFTRIFYTVLERKITYDYYISQVSERTDISPRAMNILRIGACQLLDLSTPDYVAVNECVKLAGSVGERAFVNAVLREIARRRNTLFLPNKDKNFARYLSVKYSFARPIVRHFISEFGQEDAEKLLSYFNSVRYTDLSVNLLKISREEFIEKLKAQGISAEASEYSSFGVRISESVNPCHLFGYNEGLFFVQDEASRVLCEALDVKKGMRVIDVCSAPGGKSMAIASLTLDGCEIFSFDLKRSKLSLIESSKERLGFNSVTVRELDAKNPDEALFKTADRVVCDVPCSGLGILAKKSDMRYKELSDVPSLTDIQYEILSKSKSYLKSNGILTYSTCTLNRAENEDVVNRFLLENPDFSLEPFTVGKLSANMGMITMYPTVHNTDGFFIAKLRRNNGAKT